MESLRKSILKKASINVERLDSKEQSPTKVHIASESSSDVSIERKGEIVTG